MSKSLFDDAETIKTILTRIIFFDDENGFIIAIDKDANTFKGNVHHENPKKELVKTDILFTGTMKQDSRGDFFSFTKYEIQEDFNIYFLTKMVKGISQQTAERVVERFGDKLGDIIEKSPSVLTSIKGIGDKKLIDIVTSYASAKNLRALSSFLLPFGVSSTMVKKIYNHYGEDNIGQAIPRLRKNPYLLTRIKGVGFRKADEIALAMGIEKNSEFRIDSGIVYALSKSCSEGGHTYISDKALIENTHKELGDTNDKGELIKADVSDEFINTRFSFLAEKGGLFKTPNINKEDGSIYHLISPKKEYLSEAYIFNLIKRLSEITPRQILSDSDFDKFLKTSEDGNGFTYADKQRDALYMANKGYPIMYLQGLAGSGKSSTSKGLLDLQLFEVNKDNIFCCSLSGVASQRVKKLTGYRGGTIHSLLGIEEGSFSHNEKNKLDYGVILIDECSMVDSWLFASLMRAIDFSKTKVFIVGDSAQLQSIGAGNVLYDIANSGLCNGVTLDEVQRQSKEQVINILATEFVRKGKVPEWFASPNLRDFRFHSVEIEDSYNKKKNMSDKEWSEERERNNLAIRDEIGRIALAKRDHLLNLYKEKKIEEFITDFMVITPMKKYTLGVFELNKYLQGILNPFKYEKELQVKIGDKTFIVKPKDKVMHLENKNMPSSTPLSMKTFAVESEDESADENLANWMLNCKRGGLAIVSSVDEVENELEMFQTKVLNGQMGVVVKILSKEDVSLKDDTIIVYYPSEKYLTYYTKDDFATAVVSHSWSCTIHKSQGSEFSETVMVASNSHYNMLNNLLAYTSITRAKDMLRVVGQKYAFTRACTNVYDTRRNTVLSLLFSGEVTLLSIPK